MTTATAEVTQKQVNNKAAVAQPADAQKQANGQTPRTITDPNQVAQLVMLKIDQVNSKKDELTIAVKALADTTKQLVAVYGKQQGQIAQLAKKVVEMEKQDAKK